MVTTCSSETCQISSADMNVCCYRYAESCLAAEIDDILELSVDSLFVYPSNVSRCQ